MRFPGWLLNPPRRAVALGGVALLSTFAPGQGLAQPAASQPDTVVVPGAGYGAGGLTRLLLGAGYRDLWLTPLGVGRLRIDTLAPGVAPLRSGGGFTTRTLHLSASDGTRWVIRSVDKSPSQSLPELVRETVLARALDAQVMSFFPAAPLAVPPLLEAVGVLHVVPELVVVADGPELGEYRADFAGMLATVEIRPNDGPDGQPGFAGSRRIDSTEEMLEAVRARADRSVDAEEYLRARLVDLVVGDRDRAIDNWRWARFDVEGGQRYRPIPRDRDQAFIHFDGVLKRLASWWDPRLVRFTEDIGSVEGLTRNAWDLDRRFLPAVERPRWREITAEVRSALTDSVLDDAVERLPPDFRAHDGRELGLVLRARRDALPEASEAFYRLVVAETDLWGSDEPERVEVRGRPDGSVEVVWRRPGGEPGEAYRRRIFRPGETREIRIFLLGGDDRAFVEGLVHASPTVRIAGGEGRDEVSGSRGEGDVVFYDATDAAGAASSGVRGGGAIRRIPAAVPPPVAWGDSATTRNWGSRTQPVLVVRVAADVGLVLGGGFSRRAFGFVDEPYTGHLRVTAGYALAVGEGFANVEYDYRGLGPGAALRLSGEVSGLERVNFYGFGNAAEATEPDEFFRSEQLRFTVRALVERSAPPWSVRIGPGLTFSSTDTTDEASFLSMERPYGSGPFALASFRAAVIRDTRTGVSYLAPRSPLLVETARSTSSRGSRLRLEAALFPAVFDVQPSAFGWVEGDAVVHSPLFGSGRSSPTLVTVLGGRVVFGEAPFFESAVLGGRRTLRGYPRERFTGDAAVYSTAEIRVPLATTFERDLPTEVGLHAFVDIGKVWVDGASPGGVHASIGGGVWLAPLERALTVRASVAASDERVNLIVGTGFAL